MPAPSPDPPRSLHELEAVVDRYFSAPPRGQGTVLHPEPEEAVSAAQLNRFKDASYGKGGCFDPCIGPRMALMGALQLTTEASIFSDSGYFGGGNPAELEEGRDPKLAGFLVGALVRLWRAIPSGRFLLRLWGDTITNLRDCREFE